MLFPSFCFCGTTLVQMLQKGYKKLLRPVVVEQRVFLGGESVVVAAAIIMGCSLFLVT